MITKWNFQTPTEEELHTRDKLASELELSPVVCLLLVQRGLSTVEEVKKFFKPSLNDFNLWRLRCRRHDCRFISLQVFTALFVGIGLLYSGPV